jgi:hypothetical protein
VPFFILSSTNFDEWLPRLAATSRYTNRDRIPAKTNHSHFRPFLAGISDSTTTAKSSHSHHFTLSPFSIGAASTLQPI